MVSKGFQGLKPYLFLKEGPGRVIRFESFGGSKLDEIGPDDLFCYIRLLQGRPEVSRDGSRGFQRGFRRVSEGFRRGFQTAGFRFQGDRRGPNLNPDVKNPYVWVQIDVLRGVFWATISRFVGIQILYWGDVGPFWRPKWGDKCPIKARN